MGRLPSPAKGKIGQPSGHSSGGVPILILTEDAALSPAFSGASAVTVNVSTTKESKKEEPLMGVL